jgi:hypothetical protein
MTTLAPPQDCPFFGIWFCGGWALDEDQQLAIAALKDQRAGSGGGGSSLEVFRSAAMLKKRGHFEARGLTKGLRTTATRE